MDPDIFKGQKVQILTLEDEHTTMAQSTGIQLPFVKNICIEGKF